MKFISAFFLTALLSFAACLYLPWWSIAVVAFIVAALIPQHPGKAFAAAFLALFLLWGGISFIISNNNQHLLAHKVAVLILKMDNPYALIAVTAAIGGLIAAFAAVSGSFIGKKAPSAA
jgi:hypothetical protein